MNYEQEPLEAVEIAASEGKGACVENVVQVADNLIGLAF